MYKKKIFMYKNKIWFNSIFKKLYTYGEEKEALVVSSSGISMKQLIELALLNCPLGSTGDTS